MARLSLGAAALLLLAGPASAQAPQPSVTGAAPNFNSPQAEQNDAQQPANARQVGPAGATPQTGDSTGATKRQGSIGGNNEGQGQAQGQQMSQPSMSQYTPQLQQNQGNQPGNVRELPPSAPTPVNDPSGVNKAQGPVSSPVAKAQAGQAASSVAK